MRGSSELLRLIGLAYDAAADPGRWPDCLTAISTSIRCPAVGFFPLDPASAHSQATLCVGHDPALLARYDAYYGRPEVNAYSRNVEPHMLVPGTVLRAEAVCRDRDLQRSEYFADWLRPQGLGAGGFAMLAASQRLVILSMARGPRRGHLDSDELELVRHLLPHLQRALTLGQHLVDLDAEREANAAVLDAIAVGVILVDAQGHALVVNRHARDVMAGGDGLALTRDGLVGSRADVTAELRRLVAASIATTEGRGTSAGGALALPRPSGRRPLLALVSPLAREHFRTMHGAAAASVLVRDPEAIAAPSITVLRRLFRLTPAEAALARELAAGHDTHAAAETLGVRVNTVRTQLARIFAKTGARRQSELMRLLVAGITPPLS